MKITGYLLAFIAFGWYAGLVRAINRLVSEVNQAIPNAKYRWFRWDKAWRPYRRLYPQSALRRSIILYFLASFLFMGAGMACIAVAQIREYGWPHP